MTSTEKLRRLGACVGIAVGGTHRFHHPLPTLPHRGGGDGKFVGEGRVRGDSTFSIRTRPRQAQSRGCE